MKVGFVKTDQRRYGVVVHREKAPPLWMYGPGYDDNLPHDLLHFVAEAEFGLDRAVFGDLAAGGNAKLFRPFDRDAIRKIWRHKRIHKVVLPEGTRSERLAGLLEVAWKAHHAGRPLPAGWSDRVAAAGVAGERIDDLLPRLDELAAQWRALPPGGELALEWPRPEGRRRHPPRDRRRPAKAHR